MQRKNYEHSGALSEAQEALITLRHRVRKLHWMAGGKGYDNMGRRELEQVRLKLDEADMWLAATARALNAGGKRAIASGFTIKEEDADGNGNGGDQSR